MRRSGGGGIERDRLNRPGGRNEEIERTMMSFAFDSEMAALGMSADARDIPSLKGAEGAERLWFGTAFFKPRETSADAVAPADEWITGGSAAFGTTPTTLFGLISPDPQVSNLAFRAPLASLAVTTEGTLGMLKKRPRSIRVAFQDWTVKFSMVCSLENGAARSNQEAEFLAALAPASAASPLAGEAASPAGTATDPDAALAADRSTTPAELARLAAERPDLRGRIAVHPAAYPALLTWLAELGEPEVTAALARREA